MSEPLRDSLLDCLQGLSTQINRINQMETPLTLRGLGRLQTTFLYPSSLQSRRKCRLAFRCQYPKAGL